MGAVGVAARVRRGGGVGEGNTVRAGAMQAVNIWYPALFI